MMGVRLRTIEQAIEALDSMRKTHVFQPKMNGDRVELSKDGDGNLHAFQRHLKRYTYSFDLKPWQKLPKLTCLDGEVKDGHFHPFEAEAWDGVSLLSATQEDRIAQAERSCAECGRPFEFDLENPVGAYGCTLETLLEVYLGETDQPRNTSPYWEGIVAKKKSCRYNVLGVVKDDPNWIKLKFWYAL
jgi:hypothetical protein